MLTITLKSSFSNQGQICLCGSRIFVEASIYEQFKVDFIKRVRQLIVGPPSELSTQVGALVSKTHLEKVQSYIESVDNKESRLLCGGERVHIEGFENGYYLSPAVVEVDSNRCKLNQEEIFGPVVTLMPFNSDIEALAIANDVNYGLSATVWTTNLKRSLLFSEQLETGIVWVNTWMQRDLRTPFGGVKSSGIGREGGFEVLRFFTQTKNICINYE
jgi:aminomuconate-semialdehyde/2-hydroxymuconate-6-semialdehyde dehydrogenase